MFSRTMSLAGASYTEPPRCRPAPAIVAASVGFVLLILPSLAIAQQNAFVEALAEFTAALPGTYGDEAAAARTSLDRMRRGLAEWDQTLREYESNVLAIRPNASGARVLNMHRTMGMLYLARGRFDDAVREFEAAAALSPEPLFHMFRGLAHEAAGRRAEALTAYATALTLDQTDAIAAYMVAEASFRSGAPPPPAALVTLADIVDRIAAGQYTPRPDPFITTALLPDDLTDKPMFVPWWYSDAYARLERAEYANAVEAMEAASSRDPLLTAPAPALLSGSEALRAGRVAEAIDHFATAVREAPSSEAYRMLGVAYWLSAEHERSIEHLEHAVRVAPMDERARLMLARVLEEIGETGRAERLLGETVKAIPSSALGHSRLGRIYEAANRIEDAAREYESAVRVGVLTGEAPLLVEIGALYRRALDAARAEAVFARAVALKPNDSVAHRERGRALLQMERPEAAFVELAAALLVDPTDYESYLTIAQIHLDAGRYSQAAALLTRAIAIRPDEPEAHYALATALVRAGRSDEAAPHRETFARLQALALEKQRRRIALSTSRLEASVLTEKGEFDRAVALWTQIVADEPEVPANHAGLAAALAGLGQLETAAARYEKALTLDAGASVYRQLAALYDRMKRPDAAADARARLAHAEQRAFGVDAKPDRR